VVDCVENGERRFASVAKAISVDCIRHNGGGYDKVRQFGTYFCSHDEEGIMCAM